MAFTHAATTSHSNFDSIFNAALDAYNRQTRRDLTSHPLLSRLQSCDSPDAILIVLREQIPQFQSESQSGDDGLSKWLVPTVNVLFAFSATLGEGVGIVFSPARVIFAGIGVLLSAANDISAGRAKLIELFSRVEYFFKRLDTYTAVPPTAAMTDIIVEIMVAVLSFLALATKEVKRGRISKYIKKLMGNKDVEDALQKLDRLTQEEARMAAAELMKITHAVDDRVKAIDERIQGVGGNVEDVDHRVQAIDHKVQDIRGDVQGTNRKLGQVDRNQLRDDLRTWLAPPNPSTNHNVACKTHHKGTAQWFLQGSIFSQWYSAGSLLWIHGKPGSGKSILCSAIIQDIIASYKHGTALIAYFYFDFRDTSKQNLQNLLPSFLMQLSAQSDPCHNLLSHLYYSHDRGERKPSDRAMIECLKEMLTVPTLGPTYLIMDALDECLNTSGIPSPREEVLEFVVELVCLYFSNLHICVTSRPEIDIQAALESLTLHPMSLHDERGQRKDIIDYITSVVRSDRRMRRWREEDKELVIKTLSEKADGMFRWVFCQLEVLRHCFPPSVRRILEELPESLDGTYERVLKEIRMANRTHAHRLLQSLVVAVRPLRVEELAEVIAFDFNAPGIPGLYPGWRWEDQEEAVLTACSSLVSIARDGHSRVVQFSHFSVKEFLTSKRLAELDQGVSRYYIRLQPAHLVLARACLGVLLRLDRHVDEDSVKNFPLASYAARHWVSHARFGRVSSHIKYGMQRLFDAERPHFAAWLWIYNPDRFGRTFGMRPGRPEARPLYYAARFGFRDLVRHLLIKYPGDVNARGGWDGTPLHAALSGGHIEVSTLLLKHGADVNIQDIWDGTPLHHASKRGQIEIGRWLLDGGADADARNGSGWSPLHLAAVYGRPDFARMLLAHEAEVNAQGDRGRTPLHLASANGREEVVRVLLEHGANVNARDDWERTPSELQSSERRVRVLEILREYVE